MSYPHRLLHLFLFCSQFLKIPTTLSLLTLSKNSSSQFPAHFQFVRTFAVLINHEQFVDKQDICNLQYQTRFLFPKSPPLIIVVKIFRNFKYY